MTLDDELAAFHRRSGFGASVSARPRTVPVYTGRMRVPLPNIETRRRFLKYHDLHHLLTGYSVGRIGEGEVSAWELGSGSARISPTLAIMNLIALSTGLVSRTSTLVAGVSPGLREPQSLSGRGPCRDRRRARGRTSRRFDATFSTPGPPAAPMALRAAEFACYAAAAMLIHAAIAIPPSSPGSSATLERLRRSSEAGRRLDEVRRALDPAGKHPEGFISFDSLVRFCASIG